MLQPWQWAVLWAGAMMYLAALCEPVWAYPTAPQEVCRPAPKERCA